MKTNEELFRHFSHNGIYLPVEQLSDCRLMLKTYIKKEGYFGAILRLEKFVLENYTHFIDKKKGAYPNLVQENDHDKWCKKASKRVAQLDKKTGEQINVFDSCYEAAMALKKGKNAVGNITNSIRNCGTSYGFRWAFV